ncbi:MAG: WXG100 family type VII secretion target [Microthrixaceae bacterium]
MSGGFVGMDPDQIDSVAAQFGQKAGEVDGIKSALEGQVNSTSGSWKGTDAETFRNNWPTFRQQLDTLSTALRDLDKALRNQATQQRDISMQ